MIFEDVDIDLSNITLSTIVGQWHTDNRRSNGSGKSALLEAIPYALFGVTRSKIKQDLVRRGAEHCIVDLWFTIHGKKVKISRNRSKSNTTCYITVDGKQAGAQNRVIEQVVKDLIGVDRDLFELIYFFKQDDQFKFVNATPGDRKTYLAKVFKLSGLEACQKAAHGKRATALTLLRKAEGALEALKEQLNVLPPYDALVTAVLDRSDDLAHAEVCRISRQDYFEDLTEHIAHAQDMLREFDLESKGDLDELQRLDSEHSRNVDELAQIQVRETYHKGALKQKNAALVDVKEKISSVTEIPFTLAKQLERRCEERDELTGQTHVLLNAIKERREQIDESNSIAGGKCPMCFQVVPLDHVGDMTKLAKREIEQHNEELKTLGIQVSAADIDVARIAADKVKADTDILLRSQRDDLINDVDASTKSMSVDYYRRTKLTEDQKNIQARRSILGGNVNVDGSAQFRNRLQDLVNSLANVNEDFPDVFGAMEAATNAENALKRYDEITEQIGYTQNRIDISTRQCQTFEVLGGAFGKNGIQAIIIENLISIIEQFANDMLAQMQTRFKLSLRTVKETKAGETKETLEIVVFDNGTERMFETYSGGERTLINLSLRLALSRVIGSLHGIVMQSLFLDEVLASLDEVNREEAIKVITFLAKNFQQVFIISHTNEVKDIIDSKILVRRYENHSDVVVEGQMAFV